MGLHPVYDSGGNEMSMSYMWRPASPPPPPSGIFHIGLADMMTRQYFGDPGINESVDRTQLNGAVLGDNHLGWLEGVVAATNEDGILEDAQSLIDGIREHGSIVLGASY